LTEGARKLRYKMISFNEVLEKVGIGVDGMGVFVMVAGVLISSGWFLLRFRTPDLATSYRNYRQTLGRAILLGLELLVAGDIIRTVAVAPTLESVTVLAIIVLIRTFLSIALQLELEGRWPWQQQHNEPAARPAGPA
jgi:uncharacterized membrane protein